MRTAICATWCLVLSASSAHAAAQERVVVSDAPGACDCHLEVELVTTLQDLDGRAGLSRPLVVERAGDARYLVVPTARQGALLEFDESGAFRRSVGRPGQGPGEFSVILAIRPGPGDSTLVMDAGNRRLAILDAALNVVRTARLPVVGGWFGAVGEGGLLVLSAIPGRTAASLDRIFLLDSALSIERSFMPAPARGPDTRIASRRVDAHVTFISNAGHAASYREDSTGYPFVDVWRFDVVER